MKKYRLIYLTLFWLFTVFLFSQNIPLVIQVKGVEYSDDFCQAILKYQITDKSGRQFIVNDPSKIILKVNSQPVRFHLQRLPRTQAVSILLLVDSSGSISIPTKMEIEKAIRAFAADIRETDETAFFIFNDSLVKVQPFTLNKEIFLNSLIHFKSGGTLSKIYDSIYESLLYIQGNGKNVNKALIVISDGLDEGSVRKPAEIIELSKKLKIPIYSLGYSNISPIYFESLSNLSNNTGGLFALKDTRQLASRIVSIERNVFSLSIKTNDLRRMNRVDFYYNGNIHTHYFQAPDALIKNNESRINTNSLIFIIFVSALVLVILLILLFAFIHKKRRLLNKEEIALISHQVLQDATACPENIRNIYFSMIHKKGLFKEDLKIFYERVLTLLNAEDVKPQTIEKLKRLSNKPSGFLSIRKIIEDSYITQIAYTIEGRTPAITDIQKSAFSKIILEEIKHRIDEGKKNPITLTDYDNYHGFITRTTYSPNEILLLIQQLEKGKEFVDKITKSQLAAGIDTLKAILELKQKNYSLGSIIIEPYLNEIKSKLEKIDEKLNRLSTEEKSCLSKLVISAITEHPEHFGFYQKVINEEKLTHDDISDIYKKLSSELMCAVLEEKEKSADCSALYKISVILSTSKKAVPRELLFNREDEINIVEKLNRLMQEKKDPEKEKYLNDLFSLFQQENSVLTEKMKTALLSPVNEVALDDIIEGFLFKSFLAGSQGFNYEDMQREIDSYDPETLAKLMPFMIQVVMDSQGSEKEANLGILKQLASSLTPDAAEISNISDWENWWKRNKTNVMKNISRLEEKNTSNDILGFTLHEDIIFYRHEGRNLEEIHGKIIGIKDDEISLLIRSVLELEEIIAVYSRKKSEDIYTESTYAFLRLMWIIEIENNVFECGFQFLKDDESELARQMVKLLSGSEK